MPFGCQNGEPGECSDRWKRSELAAELAVVALPRLLEPLEMLGEILLRVEGRTVDPRELRLVRVAAPVRAGEPGELHRLDRLRVLQVRSTAEVSEVALGIERDLPVGGVDELDLVRLALLLEARLRLVARNLLARPFAPFLQLAVQLGLDPLELLLVQGLREVEVVVEPVLDRGPDGDLHAGVQATHCLGQQMRGRMPKHVERVRVARVARREDLDRLSVFERLPQVLHDAGCADEHRLLGELRPDRARGVEPGRAVGKLKLGVIGEDDVHG